MVSRSWSRVQLVLRYGRLKGEDETMALSLLSGGTIEVQGRHRKYTAINVNLLRCRILAAYLCVVILRMCE